MSQKKVSPTSLERWITVTSFLAIVGGVVLIYFSRQITDPFVKDLMLGIGLALAPSGVVGVLADWLVFGKLIDALRINTSSLGDKTDSLESEISSLRVSTNFLKRSSDLGLEMIYTDRAVALREFSPSMQNEARRQDARGNLIIVGSSVKGLIENVKTIPSIVEEAVEHGCDLRILLTHPKYSQYRENQEDRPTGAIEDEIFEGIRELESHVEGDYPDPPDMKLSPLVKLYKGTPTCFMIVAGNRMLINPYPYEEEAYKSFCVAVCKVEPRDLTADVERTIYAQYMRAHFEKPWGRNSVPYHHYWLEGPNPSEAWDRDSCYGDVFVVQDAGHFYLAVYLLGQRKADVRGMPTSILCSGSDQETDYLVLPDSFSVRPFQAHSNEWYSLDNDIGSLSLHPERRRGKTSGEIEGNLLNDYLMLGVFDLNNENEIVNPHEHDESAMEGLAGQPLPLFWVWLRKRSSQGDSVPSSNTGEVDRLKQVASEQLSGN